MRVKSPNMYCYSKEKATKLKEGFNYLIGKSYYPFGKEGREFKITELKLDLKQKSIEEILAETNGITDKKFDDGVNWRVLVIIKDGSDEIQKELEEVLKVLKIRHDINNFDN